LQLDPGTYTTAQELEKELNKDTKFKTFFTFKFLPHINRFQITTVAKTSDLVLELHNGLHDVLGFTSKQMVGSNENQIGALKVNLMRGIDSFYIYCDLVRDVHVANHMTPLLQTVPFAIKEYGERVSCIIEDPLYVNINKSFIDSITIKICDHTGQIVPFEEGVTQVFLMLKRKRHILKI